MWRVFLLKRNPTLRTPEKKNEFTSKPTPVRWTLPTSALLLESRSPLLLTRCVQGQNVHAFSNITSRRNRLLLSLKHTAVPPGTTITPESAVPTFIVQRCLVFVVVKASLNEARQAMISVIQSRLKTEVPCVWNRLYSSRSVGSIT
jgi:hypothetical protein